MALIMCKVCNEELGSEPHVCDPETIGAYIHRLRQAANTAEKSLRDIQNAVMKILQQLPALEGESVTVQTVDVRRLWEAAQCQWYESKSADSFLVCWLATHHILCEAFDLFRTKKYGQEESVLTKLTNLKEACDNARKVLGYDGSRLDLTPEDLIGDSHAA